jgi:hypothetical protein
MSKNKIPFGWMPGHWGLKGKTRLRAQAEYELEGMELDMRLAEIDHDDLVQRELAQLDVKIKHKQIDLYDYDVQYNTIKLKDDPLLPEVLLDLELKHHRCNQSEHDRKLADLRSEPWVSMPDIKWDPADPSRSYFELDYNEHFVAMLRTHNYSGMTDEQIVEKWLNDVCRSVAQEFIAEDPAFVSSAAPVTRKRQPRKKKAEYS